MTLQKLIYYSVRYIVNLCNKVSKKFAPLKHFSMMKTFTFFDIILASDIDTLMLDDAQLVEPDVCFGPKEVNRAYISALRTSCITDFSPIHFNVPFILLM